MITLQVPDGRRCEGCGFLDMDYGHNRAQCLLFNEPLFGRLAYGSLLAERIEKCHQCPTEKIVEDEG